MKKAKKEGEYRMALTNGEETIFSLKIAPDKVAAAIKAITGVIPKLMGRGPEVKSQKKLLTG